MGQPVFKIRKIDLRNSADVTVINHLQKKILPEDRPYKPDHGHWWIAYAEDGKPVAFAGLVRSIRFSDAGYLCRAGVLDAFTGHGLQTKLIKARLAQAKKLGWNWVLTDTTDNPASANSLIKAGFRIYTPSEPWSFKHSIYWKYKIDQSGYKKRVKKKATAYV